MEPAKNQQQSKTAQNAQIPSDSLFLTLRNPEKILYQGEVRAISSINEKGPFDVLAKHGNFISVVQNIITIYPLTGEKMEYPIENGIIKVTENSVTILLGVQAVQEI